MVDACDDRFLAVVGSGLMGAGIAQVALAAGMSVVLYDVSDSALDRAVAQVRSGLAKQGCLLREGQLRCTTVLADISGAWLVIEAVPEWVDVKLALFAEVDALCPAPAILASNTSSLSVTRFAGGCTQPQRVAGLHFFNPVHRMMLVEVVRAAQTDDVTVGALLGFVQRVGKTAVVVRDTPGFIVNRVARPLYGEALRLVGEGVASCSQVDVALKVAGGFPLGPFALMDLVGIDVNFAVTCSLFEQSFYEPRYRPHAIQAQMVAQGALGRKSGRGFYRYDEGGRVVVSQSEDGVLVDGVGLPRGGGMVISPGGWAPGLRACCEERGFAVYDGGASEQSDGLWAAWVAAGCGEGCLEYALLFDRQVPDGVPIFVQCVDGTVCAVIEQVAHPQRFVGFDGLFMQGVMTLSATPVLDEEVRGRAEAIVRGLGCTPVWVQDAPALIVPRVVAMLANEAAFAVGEGVADSVMIDVALRLGANHPVGPLARAAELGFARVVAILDHLYAEYGEERYRVAPLLRRAARVGAAAFGASWSGLVRE